MSGADIAIYAGSFDPPTNGHLDLVGRAALLFPKVVVALGVNSMRKPLFSVEERLTLLREVCAGLPNVQVEAFQGLLVDYAKRIGARVMVRGLRVGTDFDYELQIAHANADLAPEVDTIFLPTRSHYGFVSASLVREIASHGGSIERYAPPNVCVALKKKFGTG